MTAVAPVLEAFFTNRLMTQQAASPHTIASYRDTFRLLLRYLQDAHGRQPSRLDFADLDAPVIGGFLTWLEISRRNTPATRNNRLAAIHSLFRYAALQVPEHAALISRVLDIQAKRTATTIVSYLQPAELDAILAAPDRSSWHGRRDHALLTFAAQTGLRVSEITALTIASLHLGTGPHVYCRGKGRKDRCTPLTSHTREILTAWLATRQAVPGDPLFCTRSGTPMSSDAVTQTIAKHARTAARACPSITGKIITPHTLRHTAAMTLLHAGVDVTVIALWLGHESPASTRVYLHEVSGIASDGRRLPGSAAMQAV
jgi:integrase/recombinase XerD